MECSKVTLPVMSKTGAKGILPVESTLATTKAVEKKVEGQMQSTPVKAKPSFVNFPPNVKFGRKTPIKVLKTPVAKKKTGGEEDEFNRILDHYEKKGWGDNNEIAAAGQSP